MHTKTEQTVTTTYKPSLMERMRGAKTTRATRPVSTGTRGTGGVTGTRTTRGTTATTSTRPTRTTHRHGHGTTTTATPVRRQQRKTTMGDKVSGGLMKMKGEATGRPGQKAAGTRRMHGTDGKVKKRGLFS